MELGKRVVFQTANKCFYPKAQAIFLGFCIASAPCRKIHIAFCNGAYIDEPLLTIGTPKRVRGIIGLREKKKREGHPYG